MLFSILFSSENLVDGYIYDENNNPIHNVEVYVNDISIGCTTDTSGYFHLFLPDSSQYILSISHIGYISKQIDISAFDSNTLEIYLNKKVIDANKIVVTALGYKSYVKDTPVITHVITGEEIHNSPYNSIRDIIEFVMPNVQRVHDPHGNDRVKIQGLDNKFVVFMIDGNRISGEFAGNIDFSMINTSDIEKIEIIRSGMSTLYGSDSMGGLINIITKQNKKRTSVDFSYTYDLPTVQTTSLNFRTNLYNFSYKLGLDYNDSPGYDLTDYSMLSKTLEENIYYKINNSFSYNKSSFSINYINRYYLKKIKQYAVSETMSRDTIMTSENPRYFDLMNSLSIDYEINNISIIGLKFLKESYDKSFYYPYYYNSYPNNDSDGETLLSSLPIRYDYSLFFNTIIKNHAFYCGVEYTKETYQSFNIFGQDGILAEPSIFNNEDIRIVNEYSLFFLDKFKIFNKEIVTGLRSTKYSSYRWNFIPSLSLRQEMNGYNLRLNYSRGYRIPSLKELYYNYEGHDPPLYGDSSLKPSLSNYYALSFESRNFSNSSIEFYYNNIEDMISTVYKNGGMYYSNSDKVNLYGFNVNIQKRIFNHLDFNSVYSYTDGISNEEQVIEGMSKHTFNIRIKYNIFRFFNILFTQKYNSSKSVFIFGSNDKKTLSSFNIFDGLLIFNRNNISMKVGIKNIFNYLDPQRLNNESRELLTTIDPGRRIYFNLRFFI